MENVKGLIRLNKIWIILPILLLSFFDTGFAAPKKKIRIGVTLHPYYSYVKNIVGDLAEVTPLIGKGFNPHAYKPQPKDIKGISKLDVLVLNGIGHDEFAFEILNAANMRGNIHLIYANEGVSLIPVAGTDGKTKRVNPHTFISITASIQQIYNIRRQLSLLDPLNSKVYRTNARKFVRRLRKMKARTMKKLSGFTELDFRCATIHGGYDYLLQEFGLQVTSVIEPAHGLKPTASQLAKTIDRIKALDVDVIFTEMNFSDKYIDTIQNETGIRVRYLSHLTSGEYSIWGFERGMEANLNALASALIEVHDQNK